MASTPHSTKSSPVKGRQRAQVQDPLDQAGFVSKGDVKLLDPKTQKAYYEKIVERYMKFCNDYSNDLDAAFASLPKNRSEDSTRNPPVPTAPVVARDPSSRHAQPASMQNKSVRPENMTDSAAKDLSVLLLSLRKLREGVIATASKTPVAFSQQVHIFCIRTGILASHPPSYYPPLKRLLQVLHEPSNPLSESDLHEFTAYLILDYACRQNELHPAFDLRAKSKNDFEFNNTTIDHVLAALMHDNWVQFWKSGRGVDGYTRSLMSWAEGFVRRRALKTIARAYLSVDLSYIIESCTGTEDGCTWDDLVEKEGMGWKLEGNKVIIRIRKPAIKAK
ncbi:uncharacterized protein GIQ15_01053 [Arthroderma uncinatum]|uniref:uncharacterized protein n=1 Tax=Arthroderma uncinatum TaxID=74035 RepID=UPI00144A5B09|nr:uncharacterized protein GIQ15_01053 [Arthroderma uncinatum]KAF3491536.1 hypothetical protein GIQ15_01053 [Arthroderma uncinatum]